MPLVHTVAPDPLRSAAATLFVELGNFPKHLSEVGALPRFIAPVRALWRRAPIGFAAQPAGWRFVRVSEVHSEQIDFAPDDLTCWQFASTPAAKQVATHVAAAEADLASVQEPYWPRILSLPEVQMEAVWIHSPKPRVRDRFYGLSIDSAVWPDRGFTSEAKARAMVLKPRSLRGAATQPV